MILQQVGAKGKLETTEDLKQAQNKKKGMHPFKFPFTSADAKTHVNPNLILIFTPLQSHFKMMVKRSLQE